MDGIEQELAGRAFVVRLNIHTDLGREVAHRYQIDLVPTFILFDKKGNERWSKSGEIVSRREVLRSLD